MPDYTDEKVGDCIVYFTSKCIIEAFHAHADPKRRRATAAKFFIRKDGSVVLQHKGNLTEVQLNKVKKFIKDNHERMYKKWAEYCKINGMDPKYYDK